MGGDFPLEWRERRISIWERVRDCFEAGGFDGIYVVGRVDPEDEHIAMQIVRGNQSGLSADAVAYRAGFS